MIRTLNKYPVRDQRIAYMDPFAGPGRYEDGNESTPIMIMRKAAENNDLRNRLVSLFNDKDINNTIKLKNEFDRIAGISLMKYQPVISNKEVNDQLANIFRQIKLVPTLSFIDPWGYKGLTLNLLGSLLKDFGCDCIFFFNYNRIKMGISNPRVHDHMNDLFGVEQANRLRAELEISSYNGDAENIIMEELEAALNKVGGKYVLSFCFTDDSGNRTSHYLVFASKHELGYKIMRSIMAKHSSQHNQGVPSFQHAPDKPKQQDLFEVSEIDRLAVMLSEYFAGNTISVDELIKKHSVGKPYVDKNYREALRQLEEQNLLIAEPPAERRKIVGGKRSFEKNVIVTFPAKEK